MKVNFSTTSFYGTKVNTVYYNDNHSSTKHLNSFIEMRDKFYEKNPNAVNLTLSGGDVFLDCNMNNNIVAHKLIPKTDAIAVGNHDLDSGNYLSSLISTHKLPNKFVSSNLEYSRKTPLEKDVLPSLVIEKGKEKIGIIGVSPLDLKRLSNANNDIGFINVMTLDKTLNAVRKEVKKLEDQNINKIFLLAHTGEFSQEGTDYYKSLSEIGGIDVIIGGHDHREVDRWETTERGEPVKIVATGKNESHKFLENLNYAGRLKLDFDDNGVLIKNHCKNQVVRIRKDAKPEEKEYLYMLEKPLKPRNLMTDHSEVANIIADSTLWYANKHNKNGEKADFAFVNPGTIRGNFERRTVTKDDVCSAVPFTTSLLIQTKLSKKQIVDSLEWAAKSTTLKKVAPGIMHVAGMEYTVSPEKKISNVHILNEDGSIKYNLDDFDDNKEFNAVYDTFLATGVAGLTSLKKDLKNDKSIIFFNVPRQTALTEYLSENTHIKDFKKKRIKQSKQSS